MTQNDFQQVTFALPQKARREGQRGHLQVTCLQQAAASRGSVAISTPKEHVVDSAL